MPRSKQKPQRAALLSSSRAGQTVRSKAEAVDYRALANFRFELRKFLAFSETAANKAGLTPQQHQALLTVKGFSSENPVSIGELAKLLFIKHHTAVELVDRMTKLGLLSRVVDDNDGRRALVKLTREGEQRLRKLSRIHSEELGAVGPTLARILKPFRRR
ncbi:MarR family winged helix-turn-helix transcriptional regulator [Bradyrhizobium sp. SYSU BS000235]|uniref:MarR family winged helix-turn-helix transcriptional regulator n=1 Tax=Bradyrhizobium sp. SYSU BS000235 TaxID=3411332 RepID=UPI003C77732D